MWNPLDWAHLKTAAPEYPYPMWQDTRHVQLQYQLAMSGLIRRVLEVGCYHGYSTSAYVQAMRDGAHLELACCDLVLTDQLRAVLELAPRAVQLYERPSIDVVNVDYDLVVLDGDHTIRAVSRELGLCLFHEVPTIILHDYAAASAPNCEGPLWAGVALQFHPEFHCAFDCRKRDGEFTDRGLLVASRNEDVCTLARTIIATW